MVVTVCPPTERPVAGDHTDGDQVIFPYQVKHEVLSGSESVVGKQQPVAQRLQTKAGAGERGGSTGVGRVSIDPLGSISYVLGTGWVESGTPGVP